jgi:hypothetical protein
LNRICLCARGFVPVLLADADNFQSQRVFFHPANRLGMVEVSSPMRKAQLKVLDAN